MGNNLLIRQQNILAFSGKGASTLYMYSDGMNITLAIDYYDINSNFFVTKDNPLCNELRKMFHDLKQVDNFRNLKNGRFEWISEGKGLLETQNRLMIYEYGNEYIFRFIKNRFNKDDDENICSVNFALFNSQNEKVAKAFETMYVSVSDMATKNRKNSLLK